MGLLWEIIEDAQKLIAPPEPVPDRIYDDLDNAFRLFTYVDMFKGTIHPGLATNYLLRRG